MSHKAILSVVLLALVASIVNGQENEISLERWGTLTDPIGDCTAVPNGDSLLLTIPGGHRSLNPVSDNDFLLGPRTLQQIEGDFGVEVLVERFEKPELNASTSSNSSTTKRSVEGGLLVWQDDKNFICWTRAESGELTAVIANLTVVRNGKMIQRRWAVSDAPLHLKVFREKGAGKRRSQRRWIVLEHAAIFH